MTETSLINQIAAATKLRQDKNPQAAAKKYETITKEPGFNTLPMKYQQYVWAHLGVATFDGFIPYQEREPLLDTAEEYLRTAVACGDSRYPWALAHLAEVRRTQGNLPAFSFEWRVDKFVLKLTPGECAYEDSAKFFNEACSDGAYAWGLAHHAALLLNRRRYDKVPYLRRKNVDTAISKLNEALNLLEYTYPWAVTYLGVAHFVSALDRVTSQVGELQVSQSPEAALTERQGLQLETFVENLKIVGDFIMSTYGSILGVFQANEGPIFTKTEVQPGAVALDPYFALINDLFDFTLDLAYRLKQFSDSSPQAFDAIRNSLSDFIKIVRKIWNLIAQFPHADDSLPGSSEVRVLYMHIGLYYLEALFSDSNKEKEKIKAQAAALIEVLLTNASSIFERDPRFASNGAFQSYTSMGFLIRAFDLMMTLLKLGALIQIGSGNLTKVSLLVEGYNRKLGSLLKMSVGRTIEWIVTASEKNPRLLHPVLCEFDGATDILHIVQEP